VNGQAQNKNKIQNIKKKIQNINQVKGEAQNTTLKRKFIQNATYVYSKASHFDANDQQRKLQR